MSGQAAAGRPAALAPSRVFVALLISSEGMFFAGLIAAFIVLRLAVPLPEWPRPREMGVRLEIGLLNTFVLLVSSVLAARSVRALNRGESGRAKRLWVIAAALGALFLAIKAFEYREKVHLGLYPSRPRMGVYPAADLQYVSAVERSLAAHRESLMRRRDAQAADHVAALARLQLLSSGLTEWTSRLAGSSSHPLLVATAAAAVAHAVRPARWTAEGVELWLERERQQLPPEAEALSSAKERLEARLAAPAAEAAADAAQLSAARAELNEVNTRLELIRSRLAVLDLLAQSPTGLNARWGWALPIVVPGGSQWINGYYLLTAAHAAHVAAGIVAMAAFFPRRLNPDRRNGLLNVSAYWHFVDCVWLVIFPLIYLL